MVDPNEIEAIAAAAGVVWDDSNKFIAGHVASVLMVDGGGFFHPCTCAIGFDHQALQPQVNTGSGEPPEYTPLPNVVVPDPLSDEMYADPVVPYDPSVSNPTDSDSSDFSDSTTIEGA